MTASARSCSGFVLGTFRVASKASRALAELRVVVRRVAALALLVICLLMKTWQLRRGMTTCACGQGRWANARVGRMACRATRGAAPMVCRLGHAMTGGARVLKLTCVRVVTLRARSVARGARGLLLMAASTTRRRVRRIVSRLSMTAHTLCMPGDNRSFNHRMTLSAQPRSSGWRKRMRLMALRTLGMSRVRAHARMARCARPGRHGGGALFGMNVVAARATTLSNWMIRMDGRVAALTFPRGGCEWCVGIVATGALGMRRRAVGEERVNRPVTRRARVIGFDGRRSMGRGMAGCAACMPGYQSSVR